MKYNLSKPFITPIETNVRDEYNKYDIPVKIYEPIQEVKILDKLCECGHWRFEHDIFFSFWDGKCLWCQCPKFHSIGEYSYEAGKAIIKNIDKERY